MRHHQLFHLTGIHEKMLSAFSIGLSTVKTNQTESIFPDYLFKRSGLQVNIVIIRLSPPRKSSVKNQQNHAIKNNRTDPHENMLARRCSGSLIESAHIPNIYPDSTRTEQKHHSDENPWYKQHLPYKVHIHITIVLYQPL